MRAAGRAKLQAGIVSQQRAPTNRRNSHCPSNELAGITPRPGAVGVGTRSSRATWYFQGAEWRSHRFTRSTARFNLVHFILQKLFGWPVFLLGREAKVGVLDLEIIISLTNYLKIISYQHDTLIKGDLMISAQANPIVNRLGTPVNDADDMRCPQDCCFVDDTYPASSIVCPKDTFTKLLLRSNGLLRKRLLPFAPIGIWSPGLRIRRILDQERLIIQSERSREGLVTSPRSIDHDLVAVLIDHNC